MKVLLTTIALFISTTCFCQITAVHFNADWNSANNVEWFNKLSDVDKSNKDIGNGDAQKKYSIAVVPTIIIFNEGEEVKRYQADISFTMKATLKDVQEKVNEIYGDDF